MAISQARLYTLCVAYRSATENMANKLRALRMQLEMFQASRDNADFTRLREMILQFGAEPFWGTQTEDKLVTHEEAYYHSTRSRNEAESRYRLRQKLRDDPYALEQQARASAPGPERFAKATLRDGLDRKSLIKDADVARVMAETNELVKGFEPLAALCMANPTASEPKSIDVTKDFKSPTVADLFETAKEVVQEQAPQAIDPEVSSYEVQKVLHETLAKNPGAYGSLGKEE